MLFGAILMTTKNTQTTHVPLRQTQAGRLIRLLVATALAFMLSLSTLLSPLFAAQSSQLDDHALVRNTPAPHVALQVDDPLSTLGTKIESLARSVTKFATPLAILAIVAALLMYLFAPFLP